VGRQLRQRAPSIRHHGPHSLRHACATRLINQGLSLKEVGDHLGQRDLEASRIYAKVDVVRLREVASFDGIVEEKHSRSKTVSLLHSFTDHSLLDWD
jgi:integrase/recombinase XerD